MGEDSGLEAPKKKIWTKGKEIPKFSNKTWRELNSIWPIEKRLKSNAWEMLGLLLPAVTLTAKFVKKNYRGSENIRFSTRELLLLCYIMRCEEAKSNVGTENFSIGAGMDVNKRILNARKSILVKLGFIETLPSNKVRLYRLTPAGRMIVKKLVENIEQAHVDLNQWIADQPDSGAEKVNQFLQTKYKW